MGFIPTSCSVVCQHAPYLVMPTVAVSKPCANSSTGKQQHTMEHPAQIACSHGPNIYADVHGRHVTSQYVFLITSIMGDHIGISNEKTIMM